MTTEDRSDDRVLLVEADATTSALERDAFARSGTKVHAVGSVRDALLALEANTFSAVVLDCGVSDGDAWQVVAAAHAKAPRVPVILVTAIGSERIAAEAIPREAAEYTVEGEPLWTRLPDLVQRVVERNRVQERQRRNAERFELIARHSTDVIAMVDLEGRFTFVSSAVREAYGEEPEELLGKSAIDRIHPLDRDAAAQAIRDGVAAPGPGKRLEGRRLRKDGSYVWVEAQATLLRDPITQVPTEIITIARNVTERRLASEALQAERTQLAEAQRIAQLGSWEWEIATNRVSSSAEMNRIFGLDESTLVPFYEGFMARVHPDDRARTDELVRKSLQDLQPFASDLRIVRPSGEVRFLRAHGHVVVDDKGLACKLAGTVQDVTERTEFDRRIAVADRMASIGTLAAGVAHEINNPLAYVIANLDLLAQGLRERGAALPSEAAREFEDAVTQARDGAERVRKIVRGLRTFSRTDAERREVLSLHRVIEASINLAYNEVRHRARLVKDFGAPPPVLADEARLAQVFVNLIINAAHAIPEGMADRNQIRIVTRAGDAGTAIVEVHDTGSGIPEHLRGRVFDPFFTTKSVGSGTGLGLSICHGIVTALGGEIAFECPVSKGTIFRVVLPGAPTEGEAERAVSQPSPAAGTAKRGRVLIVDDDRLLLKVLGRVLAAEHEVVMLNDARLALERLIGGERFDAILCDLMMPNMTGMDLHAELVKALPEQAQRMVFMTGGTFTAHGTTFLDEVPNQRFEKPFDSMSIRALVRSVVR